MTQIVAAFPPLAPTDLRADYEAAVAALVDLASAFREDIAYRLAVAGNGSILDADIPLHRIYVQLDAAGGEGAEAQYDSYKPELGDTILLTKPRVMGTGGWLVIGWLNGDNIPCYSNF